MPWRCGLLWVLLGSSLLSGAAGGCTAGNMLWPKPEAGAFPPWSEQLSSGLRQEAASARPSGFFTDPRSQQIEKNLGGGF